MDSCENKMTSAARALNFDATLDRRRIDATRTGTLRTRVARTSIGLRANSQ